MKLGVAGCIAALGTGCLSFHAGPLPGAPQNATYADVDGVRLRFHDKGEGPAVVMLHGFASSLETWDTVAPKLEKTHRVLSLDLKGFGWSARPEGDYSPAAQAKLFETQGFRYLHLVDLDGAFAGRPVNAAAVGAVLKVVGVPVQLGGGIRDLDTIERYLDDGVSYIIIGTAAVKNPGFLHDACSAFGGHIIVGLDAREGKVAVDGWSKMTGHDVIDLARKFEDYGVEAVVYTDIGRDGMLSGVNVDATVRLAQALRIPVIASGGIAALTDIEALCEVEREGVMGAITGRAIYEGTLDFKAAQARADQLGEELGN